MECITFSHMSDNDDDISGDDNYAPLYDRKARAKHRASPTAASLTELP
jgi:hypothetical protein